MRDSPELTDSDCREFITHIRAVPEQGLCLFGAKTDLQHEQKVERAERGSLPENTKMEKGTGALAQNGKNGGKREVKQNSAPQTKRNGTSRVCYLYS